MLHQNHAFPKQVNVALLAVVFFDRLLKRGYTPSGHTKDVKEGIPEGFCFRVFAGFVLPFAGEGKRTVVDFVPRKGRSVLYRPVSSLYSLEKDVVRNEVLSV
jgi:hypothetical protein